MRKVKPYWQQCEDEILAYPVLRVKDWKDKRAKQALIDPKTGDINFRYTATPFEPDYDYERKQCT